MTAPLVAIVMGSASDWEAMRAARDLLREEFRLPVVARVLSAHRTPEALATWVADLEQRGTEVIIAGAGMAAHLAGVVAAKTTIPVLGVPMESGPLRGVDALLSTVQMPPGIPVATFGIGKSGATNAALFAVAILARTRPQLAEALRAYRQRRAEQVLATRLDGEETP